ncbi:spore germination protein [Rossellomorea sp. SC111]|uniref:spore germination protein n=1 Tax=Rossellomorea sp. SC111 TaxID=2968985 RepID=UPI00215A8318|nr:spore germination protein [Rossellomorea sp. SC111]MCR8848100.1 spore germination protein [Rossellomorea sp. SC111]
MDSILKEIKDVLGSNDDFFMLEQIIDHKHFVLLGLDSLIDMPKTIQALEKHFHLSGEGEFLHQIEEKKEQSDLIQTIVEGKLLIYIKSQNAVIPFVDTVGRELSRGIEPPTNDNILQGPLLAFTEDLTTNIGVIRKEINSVNLNVTAYSFGKEQKKNVSLLFRTDKVNAKLKDEIISRMERNKHLELNNLQDISNMLGFPKRNVISSFKTTEIPLEVYRSLERGKIVLLLDRFPFALILPNVFSDLFFLENDRNYSYPIMFAMRLLRITGALIAVILPGLYVALVSVNPEMLRIELALSVAQSREGVPYPAFIETMLMLLILELILEASLRLPKSVGPTITMVGGIILGQAVVEARLVSNLLIIILAATTIANSTIIGFANSLFIRIFKYLLLILSAIFGVFGLFAGIFFVSAYLAGFNTLGMPYITMKGENNSG